MSADRRTPCRSFPRPITQSSLSTRPPSTRRSAPGLILSTRSRKGAAWCLSPQPDYWAKDLLLIAGAGTSTRSATDIFPRPHRGHGGVRGRRLRSPRGVHLQSLGDGIRLPRWEKEVLPRRRRRSGKGSASRKSRREHLKDRACARRSTSPLRLRDQPRTATSSHGLYDRTQSFFENSPNESRRRTVRSRARAARWSRGAGL